VLDEAIAKYKPVAILGLFSGGHDSLTAVHVASRHPAFTAAVHINTGIGVPQTRDFVNETCGRQQWLLFEYRAKEDCGQDYVDIVREHGFPGPAQHSKMYIRLKERALRVCIKEFKAGHSRRDCVLLVSGVRFQESERRMGYKEPITKDGSKIWVNIINDWSKADCSSYIAGNNIPRSPVVDLIHKSGECLCGAFAKPGEFKELAFWYPEVATWIENMPTPNGKCWGWGATAERKKRKAPGPMCEGCVA
jgi:3'-phosphoadenosine 5'-phosphosulfate sulfotransferase (PAPS reductase)/FAD synthetase